MRNPYFYLYTALSLVSAAATFMVSREPASYTGIAAGVAAAASYGFFELAERQASSLGKTRGIKIALSFTKPVYEILVLSAALLSGIVPQYLAVSVIGIVLLTQLFQEKMLARLQQNLDPRIGQPARIGAVVLTFLLSTLNQFYIFYGMWIIGVMAAYDLADILYRSIQNT